MCWRRAATVERPSIARSPSDRRAKAHAKTEPGRRWHQDKTSLTLGQQRAKRDLVPSLGVDDETSDEANNATSYCAQDRTKGGVLSLAGNGPEAKVFPAGRTRRIVVRRRTGDRPNCCAAQKPDGEAGHRVGMAALAYFELRQMVEADRETVALWVATEADAVLANVGDRTDLRGVRRGRDEADPRTGNDSQGSRIRLLRALRPGDQRPDWTDDQRQNRGRGHDAASHGNHK